MARDILVNVTLLCDAFLNTKPNGGQVNVNNADDPKYVRYNSETAGVVENTLPVATLNFKAGDRITFNVRGEGSKPDGANFKWQNFNQGHGNDHRKDELDQEGAANPATLWTFTATNPNTDGAEASEDLTMTATFDYGKQSFTAIWDPKIIVGGGIGQ